MRAAAVFLLSLTRRHLVNRVRPARMKDLDDLKKTVPRRPHCGPLDLQPPAHGSISIAARIEWCRQLSVQARTHTELEAWRAEEEGLRDALLERDHRHQYRDRPPAVFERYALGFEDGNALICLACVDAHRMTSVQ